MSRKNPKTAEKTENGGAANASVNMISKEDLLGALAEHKTALLADIHASFNRIDGKLDALQQSLDSHDTRLTSLEDHTGSLDDRLGRLEASCLKLQADNDKLRAKVTDLEGRNRRSNLRLVGVPESLEGPQPSKFFAQMLQDVFGRELLPSLPELDRAHRSLAPKPGPAANPRPVVICFHRYQQKEMIMREARTRDKLVYQGHTFRMYEDYPTEIVNQRRVYKTVMSSLYDLGLRPSLLYPARLRIVERNGQRKLFASLSEAEKYVQEANHSS